MALLRTLFLCSVIAAFGYHVAQSASNPRALALVKLVADVLYKSPANNDFIYMVEHRMMDDGIANYIEGLSSSFAARGACAEFKRQSPGALNVGPVQGRRSLYERRDSEDNELQSEVLNILNSKEGQDIVQEKADGKALDIPAPKYNSGGFKNVGKRANDDSLQNDVLNILDSAEGQEIIKEKAGGQSLDIPAPKYNSGGFRNFGKRQINTSQHNIAAGQHAGFATKSTALLARVRNICVNKSSLRLFVTALDDGTVRAAMYNVCSCNAIAENIRFYYNSGV